jgi:hypothetical protein
MIRIRATISIQIRARIRVTSGVNYLHKPNIGEDTERVIIRVGVRARVNLGRIRIG